MTAPSWLRDRMRSFGWRDCWGQLPRLALVGSLYAIFAISVYVGSSLGAFAPSFSPVGRSLALMVGFFFLPSLAEELLWRWLFIGPNHLGTLNRAAWQRIGFSTLLFTAAHPLAATLFVPHARPIFYRVEFLVIVAALGVATGISYVISKSIWPPVVLHWVTVVVWKFMLGGPFIMLGR